MSTPTMSREEWIEAAYKELCRRMGEPENAAVEKNLRERAALLATDDPPHNCSYYTDGFSPEDAVDEEITAGL
jgi:hypothetical protein